jgi:hypothetical protein
MFYETQDMTSLPSTFRRIRLELAREPGHPSGDTAHGYDFLAPLDRDGRIEAELWKNNREACRHAECVDIVRAMMVMS